MAWPCPLPSDKNLTSFTDDGDTNTQLIYGVLDTKAQNKLQVTDNVHTSLIWFLFLFNYFSVEVEPMILSLSDSSNQHREHISGSQKTFRKVTEECCMKVHFLKIWYGLCWTFPLLICLYFHFQVDNTQAELKHSDISAILFWAHCDFLSSAEIEGDWIKQKLQNLELVITIQMDFL